MVGKKGAPRVGEDSLPAFWALSSQLRPPATTLSRHMRAAYVLPRRWTAEYWLADERRRIERGEWTPPAQRAAERRAKAITLAEYGPTWIEQRTRMAASRSSHARRAITPTIFNEHIEQAVLGKIPLREHRSRGCTCLARRHPPRQTHLPRPCVRPVARDAGDRRHRWATSPPTRHSSKGGESPPASASPIILTWPRSAGSPTRSRPNGSRLSFSSQHGLAPASARSTELRRMDCSKDCSVITIERAVVHRDKPVHCRAPRNRARVARSLCLRISAKFSNSISRLTWRNHLKPFSFRRSVADATYVTRFSATRISPQRLKPSDIEHRPTIHDLQALRRHQHSPRRQP